MAAARARGLAEPTARPGFDAYAGMLLLSLLAMVAGTVLLLMDYVQYPDSKPTLPSPSRPAAVAPAGGAAAGGVAPAGGAAGGVAPAGGAAKGPGKQ
jgi:hypothetical protein